MRRRALWALAALLLVFSCSREEMPGQGDSTEKAGQAGNEETVFTLENATVRAYLNFLELMPYRDGDYSYSVIDDYYRLTSVYRKDHPRAVSLSWEKAAGGGTQRIYLAENPDFEGSMVLSVSGMVTSYDVYNLIPGRKYWWKVTSLSGEEVGGGEFRTIGRRRFIKLDNVCNVRDLGGIPTADGKKQIKYGLIFRGGEMNGYHQDYDGNYCRINVNGTAAAGRLGIKANLDLRTAAEALDITASPLGEGIDYARFEEANAYYYDKFWNSDVYVRALQWLIDELRLGKPVFFNCIYGADRTGTLAFILEALLGVGENQLSIDYELTSFSYGLENAPRRRGPKNEVSVIRYRQMLEGLLSPQFGGASLQEKVRGWLSGKIPEDELDWFVSHMLEDKV